MQLFQCLDFTLSFGSLLFSLWASFKIFRKTGSTVLRSLLFMCLTGAFVYMAAYWRVSLEGECQRILHHQQASLYWHNFLLMLGGTLLLVSGYLSHAVIKGIRREREVLSKR